MFYSEGKNAYLCTRNAIVKGVVVFFRFSSRGACELEDRSVCMACHSRVSTRVFVRRWCGQCLMHVLSLVTIEMQINFAYLDQVELIFSRRLLRVLCIAAFHCTSWGNLPSINGFHIGACQLSPTRFDTSRQPERCCLPLTATVFYPTVPLWGVRDAGSSNRSSERYCSCDTCTTCTG